MIPDARLYAPVNPDPQCDCLEKTKAAHYRTQFICEDCECLLEKLERAAWEGEAELDKVLEELDKNDL